MSGPNEQPPLPIPAGFRFAGVHCGIKEDTSREDLSLIVADQSMVGAAVYTQNNVVAAPVLVDRERTPADDIRLIVANSGNANACTGERGLADARQMLELAAVATGVDQRQALVLSTGVIGEHLPMSCVTEGIRAAAQQLSSDRASVLRAARGLMTTDTRPKISGRTISTAAGTVSLLGLAKGAAMIGPNMATMLAVILTDAPLRVDGAQRSLTQAVDDSFNCVSVEGHTSTNDTVVMLAKDPATSTQAALEGADLAALNDELKQVCIDLAKEIADDGEGATHRIELVVQGCRTRREAHQIAKTVANSSLVKTAVAGADPNWGRIVSAAGYAGVPFDPAGVRLSINGFELFRDGSPVPFDETQVSDSMRRHRQCDIHLTFVQGDAGITFWSCDLTAEYVRLNADYRT